MSRIRNKIVFGVFAIAAVFTLAAMGAVSWMISHQYRKEAVDELARSAQIIQQALHQRELATESAASQLSGLNNLGSTLWYLNEFGSSLVDPHFTQKAYLDMARDCRRLLDLEKLNNLAIYDPTGTLSAYALRNGDSISAGYRVRWPKVQYYATQVQGNQNIESARMHSIPNPESILSSLSAGPSNLAGLQYIASQGRLLLRASRPVSSISTDSTRKNSPQLGTVIATSALDDTALQSLRQLIDVHIILYTPEGLVAGTLPKLPAQEWKSLLRATKADNGETTIEHRGTSYDRALIPLYDRDKVTGILMVLKSREMVSRNIQEINLMLGTLSFASLALLLPLALFFANNLSRPISLLSRLFGQAPVDETSLCQLDRNQLKQAEARQDEIGSLAGSLINMSHEVNRQIQFIEEINASLEQTVSERTREISRRAQEVRALLDSSPNGIALFRESGQCVLANDSYTTHLGTNLPTVMSSQFGQHGDWHLYTDYQSEIEKLTIGETLQIDALAGSTSEKNIALEYVFKRILIDGEPHLLLITNDISDRIKVVQALKISMHQLEAKELAKTRFLAAAGHDLRQPLAANGLFLDALMLTELNREQTRIVENLQKSMSTFNGLLDGLLNISKLDAGVVKPEQEIIHVSELMIWIDETFAPLTADKRLGFKLYFPIKYDLAVLSDINLVKSVLLNLVSNAIKYTHQGAIMVSARKSGDQVRFQVWDTGIGIDEAHLDKIYEEFYQVDNPQRDRTQGLGLGLSIAKRALDLIGSRISCHTRSGHGTVFSFSLPQANSFSARHLEHELPDDVPMLERTPSLDGFTILLVEDDVLVGDAMFGYLEGAGAVVKHFLNAEDALEWSLLHPFDYVIADYMLAGEINGMQFLNRLQKDSNHPIKAVLLTGDTSAATLKLATQLPWPLLHKPVQTGKLLPTLLEQT